MDLKINVLYKVKLLLKDRSLTIDELAKGVEMTRTALTNTLNNKVSLKFETLIKIADFLSVDIVTFFQNESSNTETSTKNKSDILKNNENSFGENELLFESKYKEIVFEIKQVFMNFENKIILSDSININRLGKNILLLFLDYLDIKIESSFKKIWNVFKNSNLDHKQIDETILRLKILEHNMEILHFKDTPFLVSQSDENVDIYLYKELKKHMIKDSTFIKGKYTYESLKNEFSDELAKLKMDYNQYKKIEKLHIKNTNRINVFIKICDELGVDISDKVKKWKY